MKWDLSVLYQSFDDPAIEKDFARTVALCGEMKALLETPGETKETLEKYAAMSQEGSLLGGKMGEFASLTLATDATNERAMQLMDRLMKQSVEESLVASAFSRYLKNLTDEAFEAAIAGSKKLQEIDYSLRYARQAAEHLPAPEIEEWLLNMSLTGAEAFSQLRDKLDATLMVDYRGEQLPLAAVRGMAEDPDPKVRRDAYEAELKAYPKLEHSMAACLNAIKGEGLTLIKAEKFDSILDATLFHSAMDRETLEAMWTACREFFPAFRSYMRKKAELLGHKNGLPFYDLFAPVSIGDAPTRTYTAEEAHEILVREMSKFTPEMGEFIDRAFNEHWIDMFPYEGKGGGAFCAGVPSCEQSRVLTNFTGSMGDVSTLAHELGHAWHNYCMKGLPLCMRNEPMPLAETASIFNETLLANVLRAGAEKEELFGILESELQNATQVIVDIYSRYLFETAVIEGRKTHQLSVEELKNLMLDAQDQSYGDGLDPDFRHPYMWVCKSHYYIPGFAFYNFPYAFGLLFGKGVFAQYQEKGAAFVPTYNQLLRSCGSGSIAQVASSVGIDVHSVDFWRESLRVIEEDIKLFNRLADEYMAKA